MTKKKTTTMEEDDQIISLAMGCFGEYNDGIYGRYAHDKTVVKAQLKLIVNKI